MKKILVIIGICVLAFFACKKDIVLLQETAPTIVTVGCTNLTDSSVTLHCKITNKGGVSQPSYGFYYSDEHSPTSADKKISITDGSFAYTLIGLKESTTYYVRAFAQNKYGEVLGGLVKFTTLSKQLPVLGITSVANVTTSSAVLISSIVSEGTSSIKERGFCISTKKTPTIADSCITVTLGDVSFSYTLQNLEDGVTFYVRAYAISEVGTAYGELIDFSTQFIEGAIQANFSVSATKQVYFSNGNLQYQASTSTWRFAENQWDFVGAYDNGTVYENGVKSDNTKIAAVYDGWIDLFGWGTSGYNDKKPYMTSLKMKDYGDGDNDISGTNYDWGIYNAISNGGNAKGQWHTLTQAEWEYLINSRSDALSKYGLATVNDVNGLILLPDYWILPNGLIFVSGAIGAFSQNTYSYSDWNKMEANGAVFLPAAGQRYGVGVTKVGSGGYYCAGSGGSGIYAVYADGVFFNIDLYDGNVKTTGYYRNEGFSVRLVKDVK